MIQSIFPRFSDSMKGIVVKAALAVSEPYGQAEDQNDPKTEYLDVWFLFRRASNYTDVWVAYPDHRTSTYKDLSWEHVVTHDSGWRDGVRTVLSRQYFRMCRAVGNDRVAPKNMDITLQDFSVEDVSMRKVTPDPDNTYRYLVEGVYADPVAPTRS